MGRGPFGGSRSFGSVRDCTWSSVVPGASSRSNRPSGVTSIRASSVTMWSTTSTPVSGREHFFRILGWLSRVACSMAMKTRLEHATRDNQPKILKKCSLPLTGVEVVDHIVTELALIDVTPSGLLLREIAPDTPLEQVQSLTEPKLHLPPGGPRPMPT